METNFFSNPIVMITIAILLLPLMLRILEQSVPLLQERVTAVFPVLSGWMQHTFRWSGQLVTDAGALSTTQAIAQGAGAVTMIAFAVVFIVCELQFTWATLCPMFGGVCTGEVFAGFDRLLAFSTIFLALEFGLIVTDLLGVTYTTHFARVRQARLFFLGFAVLCALLSITDGGVMAFYRDLVLGMGQPDVAVVETTVALQNLQTFLLVSLAILLFIGSIFALMSFDTFCATVLAGVAVVGGVGLALSYLLLNVLDLLTAVALVIVKTLQESLSALKGKFQQRGERAKARRKAMRAKLENLVTPRASAKAA